MDPIAQLFGVRHRRAWAWILGVVFLGMVLPATGWCGQDELGGPLPPHEDADLREAFEDALVSARGWADGLTLDAVALQAYDAPVKGKKKLAELLDLYLLFYERADEAEREVIRGRVAALAAQTRRAEYQNLMTCPKEEFEANSLSYLRIYMLLDRFGLLESRDLQLVRAAQPRLDNNASSRGPWQKAMFASYYDVLGLEKPASLEVEALSGGIVERRVPLDKFGLNEAYGITHEVFVAFDYGARSEQDLFDDEDLLYLRAILLPLQRLTVQKQGFDLMGEVVSCNTYLGNTDDPSYRAAVEGILAGQNANGTWGDYEAHRKIYGDSLEAQAYLHTTLVCVAALLDVFER